MLPLRLKYPVATSKIRNLSDYLEITNFVARTRETVTLILHTIILDINKTYFVWPLYLIICRSCIRMIGIYIFIMNVQAKCNDRHLR